MWHEIIYLTIGGLFWYTKNHSINFLWIPMYWYLHFILSDAHWHNEIQFVINVASNINCVTTHDYGHLDDWQAYHPCTNGIFSEGSKWTTFNVIDRNCNRYKSLIVWHVQISAVRNNNYKVKMKHINYIWYTCSVKFSM